MVRSCRPIRFRRASTTQGWGPSTVTSETVAESATRPPPTGKRSRPSSRCVASRASFPHWKRHMPWRGSGARLGPSHRTLTFSCASVAGATKMRPMARRLWGSSYDGAAAGDTSAGGTGRRVACGHGKGASSLSDVPPEQPDLPARGQERSGGLPTDLVTYRRGGTQGHRDGVHLGGAGGLPSGE